MTKSSRINHSFRLSKTAHDLLRKVAAHMGITNTACIELAIREMAQKQGVR